MCVHRQLGDRQRSSAKIRRANTKKSIHEKKKMKKKKTEPTRRVAKKPHRLLRNCRRSLCAQGYPPGVECANSPSTSPARGWMSRSVGATAGQPPDRALTHTHTKHSKQGDDTSRRPRHRGKMPLHTAPEGGPGTTHGGKEKRKLERKRQNTAGRRVGSRRPRSA